ncbi:MAG: nuclease-related domain-containing protein [bacterium]
MTVDHRPKGRPHDNEQRGIRRIVTALDDTAGDYLVYSNIELPTRRAGHTYEHDLVVVAPHALFTIELKSYGGRIRGNRDRWTLEDGTLIQSPIPLVTHKARVLKGQLQARHHALADLWVQGLVFVTGLDARLELSPDFADFVVTLDDVIPAITRPEAFGLTGRRIDPRVRRHLVDYLDDGQPAPLDPRLGPYRLIERLLEADRDAPFEAWRAERNGIDRRVHLYRIKGADTHHRARLRERAMREASLLERLRGAPHLVGYLDYDHIPEPEEAVLLAFEDDTDRMPLTGWLETAPPALAPRPRSPSSSVGSAPCTTATSCTAA